MGTPINLLGDVCSGHGGYPPRPSISGHAPNVRVNGKPVLLSGGVYNTHCSGSDCHQGNAIGTATNIRVNGTPVTRTGDPVSCGSRVIGSGVNVHVGK